MSNFKLKEGTRAGYDFKTGKFELFSLDKSIKIELLPEQALSFAELVSYILTGDSFLICKQTSIELYSAINDGNTEKFNKMLQSNEWVVPKHKVQTITINNSTEVTNE